jgi:hypothetical protein
MLQSIAMEVPRAISWEAPEFHYAEKRSDWYFALGIIVAACAISAFLLGNFLFALLSIVAGFALAVAAGKKPEVVPFAVTVRGIRVNEELYPFSQLVSFYIDEEDTRGPQLLVLARRSFMPILVMPLPPEHVDVIEDILKGRLPEEHLEEPLFTKVLEFFGF